ncbi:MAG TPA: tRNA lysidine(34) synthetase TilS, partial [Flavisolibacter sp.]
MLETFTRFFADRNLSLTKSSYLLAVSGGVDSVVLCELSKQAGISFAIAHCNFGLRGEESERDEVFVCNVAEQYGVAFFVKKFDTALFAGQQKLSIQEGARKLRYEWFENVRKDQGFAYTLLAHHANDNIETMLMNFFRGTGLEGLTGMRVEKQDEHCLRPMLQLRRSEIEAFAKENDLTWVEDSSNESNTYTRNFFRNKIIPQLQNVFPQVEENLLKNLQRFGDTNMIYETAIKDLKRKLYEVKGEEVQIPVLKLMNYRNTS